ncbi:hypothetical protein [Mesorhizobium sp. M1428]
MTARVMLNDRVLAEGHGRQRRVAPRKKIDAASSVALTASC